MILIVGLGNPGKKLEKTRHNLGFLILDEFFKKNKNLYNFSDFFLKRELDCLISEGEIGKKKIVLAKPQTFINNSGKAVKLLFSHFKLPLSNLWVVHDEVDLLFGKIKIVKNRGSAGHKGVQSIIEELKTKNFVRFRVGIKPNMKKQKNIANFVLQRFNKEEKKILKKVIKKCVEAIEFAIKERIERAMSQFNR